MLLSYYEKGKVEAGCDEAGRGCLAGPVVAAAVILPQDYKHPLLNDSKQLSEKKRVLIRKDIEKDAIAWATSFVDHEEIDKVNILNASFLAMNRAVDDLITLPELLLIDGNRYKSHNAIPYTCIVKGDAKYLAIAAASVLAKTYRDEFMATIGKNYPAYQWHRNKGYPTGTHRAAIEAYGLTPYHRKSFKQLPDQLDLFERR